MWVIIFLVYIKMYLNGGSLIFDQYVEESKSKLIYKSCKLKFHRTKWSIEGNFISTDYCCLCLFVNFFSIIKQYTIYIAILYTRNGLPLISKITLLPGQRHHQSILYLYEIMALPKDLKTYLVYYVLPIL